MAKEIIIPDRTLVLVKPEAMDFRFDFLGRIDEVANRVFDRKLTGISASVWEEHYSQYSAKPYFPFMIKDLAGRDVHLAIYDGENVIQRVRDLQGKTNPFEAVAGTIRGDYRDRLIARGVVVKQDFDNGAFYLIRNFLHASDSPESFIREGSIWSKPVGKDLVNYGRD